MKRAQITSAIAMTAAAQLFCSAVALADPLILTYIEHNTNFEIADTGKPGDSPGDIMTFANKVFDANNQMQVGTDNGFCIRTVVGEAYECNWTTFLADGQITVEGPFYDAKDSVLAVIGGTGAYKNSYGQLKLHTRDPKAAEIDFVFEIDGLPRH